MKKYLILFILAITFATVKSQTLQERLISSGTWFLFSSKVEQQEEDIVLTQVTFYKKDDTSSLLFDEKNRLFSVSSEQGNDINEDLWKLLDDKTFVITNLSGQSLQIMEILEFSPTKLVLRCCNDPHEKNTTCIINTYFSTKAGWLTNTEIEELNSAGILEVDSMTP